MEEHKYTLEDFKAKVGIPWLTLEYEMELGRVRSFVEAVGDTNPKWQGRNLEVPPALLPTLGFEQVISKMLGSSGIVLHGSTDLDVFNKVMVGDALTVTAMISSVKERQSENGKIAFITLEKGYTNQRKEQVAHCRQLAIIKWVNT